MIVDLLLGTCNAMILPKLLFFILLGTWLSGFLIGCAFWLLGIFGSGILQFFGHDLALVLSSVYLGSWMTRL